LLTVGSLCPSDTASIHDCDGARNTSFKHPQKIYMKWGRRKSL
jgi:hypothetical protein